jgi:hypothetical protein
MRMATLLTLIVAGCASSGAQSGLDGGPATRTSETYLGRDNLSHPVIRVQAGPVRVRHTVPSSARLRATVLEGLDASNRRVRYEWDRDGTFDVTVSGRYRHSVTGSMVGGGSQRLSSTITYIPLPDSTTS